MKAENNNTDKELVDDEAPIQVTDHLLIRDVDSGKVLVNIRNTARNLPQRIQMEANHNLKEYYVYAICDPRTYYKTDFGNYLPIYIGNGKGNRCFAHIEEAKGERKETTNALKLSVLRDIINAGDEPIIVKIIESVSSDDAYAVEDTYIKLFGRIGRDPGGILTNRFVDKKSLGGGKKGMKHKKKRDSTRWSESKRGSKASELTKLKMSLQRTGKKMSEESKAARSEFSSGEGNANALSWTITHPDGTISECKGLRKWCRDNDVKYDNVYHSRNGWIGVKHGNGRGGRPKKEN